MDEVDPGQTALVFLSLSTLNLLRQQRTELLALYSSGRFTDAFPEPLIGDKAYDGDGLDQELAEHGIEMIAPNRAKRRKTQDGRGLRRYRRRWKWSV